MPSSKTRSVSAPLFDWLKDYDRRAGDFQQAGDWLQYSFFAFARFPRLRPTSRDSFRSAGLECFSRGVASWEKRIAQHLKAKLALKDLSGHQRQQLAALVSDTVEGLELFVNRRGNKASAAKLKKGDGLHRLRSKYRDACLTLEALSKYSAKLDRIIGCDCHRRATAALSLLRQSSIPTDLSLKPFAAIHTDLAKITHDPTTEAMVQLYWFFRSDCNLNGDESEVRVALIRNAFWIEFGILKVSYRETYRAGESRGCDAVNQAVRRFKPR